MPIGSLPLSPTSMAAQGYRRAEGVMDGDLPVYWCVCLPSNQSNMARPPAVLMLLHPPHSFTSPMLGLSAPLLESLSCSARHSSRPAIPLHLLSPHCPKTLLLTAGTQPPAGPASSPARNAKSPRPHTARSGRSTRCACSPASGAATGVASAARLRTSSL